MHSRQDQIDEEQIHLDVADALPDAEGGSVDSVRASLDRRQRVGQTETTVPVPVPVDLHLLARRRHDIAPHETH